MKNIFMIVAMGALLILVLGPEGVLAQEKKGKVYSDALAKQATTFTEQGKNDSERAIKSFRKEQRQERLRVFTRSAELAMIENDVGGFKSVSRYTMAGLLCRPQLDMYKELASSSVFTSIGKGINERNKTSGLEGFALFAHAFLGVEEADSNTATNSEDEKSKLNLKNNDISKACADARYNEDPKAFTIEEGAACGCVNDLKDAEVYFDPIKYKDKLEKKTANTQNLAAFAAIFTFVRGVINALDKASGNFGSAIENEKIRKDLITFLTDQEEVFQKATKEATESAEKRHKQKRISAAEAYVKAACDYIIAYEEVAGFNINKGDRDGVCKSVKKQSDFYLSEKEKKSLAKRTVKQKIDNLKSMQKQVIATSDLYDMAANLNTNGITMLKKNYRSSITQLENYKKKNTNPIIALLNIFTIAESAVNTAVTFEKEYDAAKKTFDEAKENMKEEKDEESEDG